MLISHPPLDTAFSNPVDLLPSEHTYPGWLDGPAKDAAFRPPAEEALLQQLRDCLKKAATTAKKQQPPPMVEPEEDLRCLVENERQLELSGYYYGSLSWLDASHLLRRCKVGTFLVRDSEHCSYLYTLSVQTRKGPTSCRIEYSNGSFRLDSSRDLSHKMPRFECVTHLVDFYVRLPKSGKAVWLDMDEENSLHVPVQIYTPLYRQVRSLQHMCRVSIVRQARTEQSRTVVENPASSLDKALDSQCLPLILREYLGRYPYSQ